MLPFGICLGRGFLVARTVKDNRIGTRKARERLPVSRAPVWLQLEQGRAIGYRKSREGGAWIARMYVGDRRYAETRLGAADDTLDADGADILDFSQAQAAARFWFANRIATQSEGENATPYTIGDACDDYVRWFEANRKSIHQTKTTIDGHIRGAMVTRKAGGKNITEPLASRPVIELSTAELRGWLAGIASAPRRLRKRKNALSPRLARAAVTDEEQRRRRSSANRILTVLKAILNRAVAEWDVKERGEPPSTKAWDLVKGFKEADAARVRFLEADEARRLVNACPPDFRMLVRGALHTGARYGELARLTVADFRDGRILIALSKGAKSRWVSLDEEGRAFFDSITAGRTGTEAMFRRDDGGSWGKTHQARRIEDACAAAKIAPRCTFHELRHTYASLALMAGMPIMVLAQNLGHRDTRMVEKHYGHLLQSYKDQMVERFAPKFGFSSEGTVSKLRGS